MKKGFAVDDMPGSQVFVSNPGEEQEIESIDQTEKVTVRASPSLLDACGELDRRCVKSQVRWSDSVMDSRRCTTQKPKMPARGVTPVMDENVRTPWTKNFASSW